MLLLANRRLGLFASCRGNREYRRFGEMVLISHCCVLLGVWSSLVLGGYWVAARLTTISPEERFATSVLAGLCLLIWNVSVLGFFRPLSGPWLWVCLWPVGVSLFRQPTRTSLRRDFFSLLNGREGRVAAASFGVFTLMLLWPLLARPGLIFFDGTSNHDAFFWISGAEFLRDHTYMVEPVKSAVQPLTNGVGVFTGGWTPRWGRMSAEGLVALASGVSGISTVQLYVAATVALFLPWVAAVYLVAKTFLVRNFSLWAIVALCATQPLFVFFQANANLPNLLGCLTGALLMVATQRALRDSHTKSIWHGLLALSLHGLLCSYPEMAPFVLLSVVLLGGRAMISPESRPAGGSVALAGLAGLALNPATTVRAVSGFCRSFHAASVDAIWPKLFEPLSPTDHVPALATLTLHTADDAGVWLAGLGSIALIVALIAVLRRAPDRFGAATLLAGPVVLLGYTLVTHFSYGWQKVAQFGGIALAAMLPVAAVNLAATSSIRRPFAHAALAGLMIFFVYATGRNIYESNKWSHRKYLGEDWLSVRDYTHQHLANATVRIDAPNFSAPFFYGMWSLYALSDTHPLFSKRESDNGGYVHDYTRNERDHPDEIPAAYFVSAQWAETFDANSPRILSGQTAALLRRANRVETLEGFSQRSGVPEFASSHLSIALTPHSPGKLQFRLSPADATPVSPATWHIIITMEGERKSLPEVTGAPPWHFDVPLLAGRLNEIEITGDGHDNSRPFPYRVTGLIVVSGGEK